jgi:hypothetical protein
MRGQKSGRESRHSKKSGWPVILGLEAYRENRAKHTKTAKETSRLKRWIKELSAPATIATLLLFLATLGLYLATRDLVHDAERTGENQLRAYMLMKTDGALAMSFVGRTDDSHALWQVVPIAENTGITPALGLEFYTYFSIRLARDWRMRVSRPPDFTHYDTPVRFDVGGHQPTKGPLFQLDGRMLNWIRDGHLKWTMYVALAYRDIFAKRRLTQYCGVVHLVNSLDYDAGQFSSIGQSVTGCPKYNCADQYCDSSERFRLPARNELP